MLTFNNCIVDATYFRNALSGHAQDQRCVCDLTFGQKKSGSEQCELLGSNKGAVFSRLKQAVLLRTTYFLCSITILVVADVHSPRFDDILSKFQGVEKLH